MSRILVIEDSPSIGLLLRRRLEMAGHSVQVEPDGKSALEVLAGADGLPDLVVSDLSMPGIDGIETIRQIKSRHRELPAILVTAHSLAPEQQTGADEVIGKPIDFDRLLKTVARLT